MKKTFKVFSLLLFTTELLFGQTTLVGWDFNGLTDYGSSPLTPTTSAANLTVVGLTRGNGITISGSAAANAWGGNGMDNTSEADALTGNDYIYFSIQANTGYVVSINSIHTYNVRRSATGSTTGQWQYQIASGSFVDIGTDITWGTNTTASGNAQTAIDLSGVTELQNISAGTTITFRCILWGASGSTGTWYLNDFQTNNDFIVDGTEEAVPVELTSFSINFQNGNVFLNWQTATEVNNYGFEVERSQTSDVKRKTWIKIGFVNGSGNSNSPKDYSFFDRSVTSGKYSYRLKQIDTDGKYEYSNEAEVDLGLPKYYVLEQNYPNPFNPTTKINYTLPVESDVQLQLFTIAGELVKTLVNEKQSAGAYTMDLDASDLASGTYIYGLKIGDPFLNSGQRFIQSKKMTLIK